MLRKRRAAVVAVVLVFSLVSVAESAPAGYEIALDSGTTYTLHSTEGGSFDVRDDAGEFVGEIRVVEGGGYEVFNVDGKLLGTADSLNPDALEVLDRHLGEKS